jgi:hypothetical protein
MIKHDHENKLLKQFLHETNLNRISQITFHISKQDVTKQVTSIFATSRIFREQSTFSIVSAVLSRKRERLSKRKTAYNRHVLEEKKNKNFQDN